MKRISIGSLAAASNTQVTTVRFYERAGLLPSPERTAGGHRHYTSDHLRRLRFIRRARELKFSVDAVKTLLVFAKPAQVSCGDIRELAAAHLQEVRRQITELSMVERKLAAALDQCAGKSTPSCPVLDLLEAKD